MMKGKDLIKWIRESHAEEWDVLVVDRQNKYREVTLLWEGESNGASIMIDTNEVEKAPHSVDE